MSQSIVPLLYTQAWYVNDIARRLRDPGFRRWERREIKRAINDGLREWSGRVAIPYVYTISGGWVSGTYEYTLPSWMPKEITPQRRVVTPYVSEDGSGNEQYIWADLLDWTLEPNTSGSQTLRTAFNEGTVGTPANGRILWWGEAGQLPDALDGEEVGLSAGIDADDTTLTITNPAGYVPNAGYIQIDQEIIIYAGVTVGSSTSTLNNLTRGAADTTAASHSSGADVLWSIPFVSMQLKEHLDWATMAHLHALPLTESPGRETEHHQWQMRWYRQAADDFWKKWTPNRGPSIKIGRRALNYGMQGVEW